MCDIPPGLPLEVAVALECPGYLHPFPCKDRAGFWQKNLLLLLKRHHPGPQCIHAVVLHSCAHVAGLGWCMGSLSNFPRQQE